MSFLSFKKKHYNFVKDSPPPNIEWYIAPLKFLYENQIIVFIHFYDIVWRNTLFDADFNRLLFSKNKEET